MVVVFNFFSERKNKGNCFFFLGGKKLFAFNIRKSCQGTNVVWRVFLGKGKKAKLLLISGWLLGGQGLVLKSEENALEKKRYIPVAPQKIGGPNQTFLGFVLGISRENLFPKSLWGQKLGWGVWLGLLFRVGFALFNFEVLRFRKGRKKRLRGRGGKRLALPTPGGPNFVLLLVGEKEKVLIPFGWAVLVFWHVLNFFRFNKNKKVSLAVKGRINLARNQKDLARVISTCKNFTPFCLWSPIFARSNVFS